ncbi:MAG: thioredoxin domain-containing protein [Myxococcota bacterium]
MKSSKEGKGVTIRQEAEVAKKDAPAAAAGAGAQGAEDVFKVPVGGAPVLGKPDALVTIVEFSDFQCPFCSRVVPTIKQIEQDYGDKVRVAFRHNPLPFHQNAEPAALMAAAAAEQGKFWELHDKLFGNQQALDQASIERYASEAGVDVAKAKAFIDSGKAKQVLSADMALAAKVGARGTPAFFINGVNLSGAQPIENFKKVIDAQIVKAQKLVDSGTSKSALYDTLIAQGKESAPPPAPPQAAPPATRQKVDLVSGTPQRGAKSDALVTIVEWSDFECPFCSRAVPTVDQILKTYGDKVAFQFRHQPLPFHPHAMPAAKAAVAAGKQGKFWEMHDKLFANQKALNDTDFEQYAKEIGLNVAKWKADLAAEDVDALIKKDMADGSTYGARGTPSFFVNGVPIRGAMPFDSFKSVIDKEIEMAEKLVKEGTKKRDVYTTILAREAGKPVAGADPGQQPQRPAAPTGPVDVKFGKAPVRGKANAPIQIVLFSDFQCPFCSRVEPSLTKVRETYGDKVAIAFKHYPLPFHPNAKPAAIAAMAAQRQGKFWEMHDKMFANQQALSKDSYIAWAKELGLNVDKFTKDLDDPEIAKAVDEDMAEGSKFGVNGTPASFVNGRLVSGAQPFEAFQAIIDEELKKKS